MLKVFSKSRITKGRNAIKTTLQENVKILKKESKEELFITNKYEKNDL